MAGKFHIFKDTFGEFRWRLKAETGEIVAASEGYTKKDDAVEDTKAVQRAAGTAELVDETD